MTKPAPTGPAPCPRITVIGAGPAGLIAAEWLAKAGAMVTLHDQMPSAGRKFLMAGRGGLNLTHSEPLERFLTRYAPPAPALLEAIRAFPPAEVMAWCEGLGEPVFKGSSGRIFPRSLKASPLLRAWLLRLGSLGVSLRLRSRWTGWTEAGAPSFQDGAAEMPPDATLLALGGASWPRLGADGGWPALLPGLAVSPWKPANMGFEVAWPAQFGERFQGTPLKRIALRLGDTTIRGEALVTRDGLEGGALYAISARLRDRIAAEGAVDLMLDLRPDLTEALVAERLGARPRAESLANGLRKALALPPVAIALVQGALRATGHGASPAQLVKALPLRLIAAAPIDRAISSAGGVAWSALDARFMLKARPGVFACGEMLDWEAPTGGYLLQGCFSTGVAAAKGLLDWWQDGIAKTTPRLP